MKLRSTLLFVLILSMLLTACTTNTTATPTLHGDPLAPTVEAKPVESTPTLHVERVDPVTPTPEVFNPLDPSPNPTATALPPVFSGTEITFGVLSLVLPQAVASGASGAEQPRVDSQDAAWWQKTPGHLQVSLGDYYVLQGKAIQPQIYVFPAQAYAELVPAAFESLHRLNNYLYDPSAPVTKDQLPTVPFFNSVPMIASHVQPVAFQNGRGVRMVTWYSQGLAPITNNELFYHFEGVTEDGQYYFVVILPVTAPVLQENATPGAVVPEGGVSMPDLNGPNPDMKGYNAKVQQLLDGLQDSAFTPNLEQLDLLIQSMRVAP